MAITPTPQQFPSWESQLLQCLGAPNSVNNLTALNLWAQSEGNVVNNALATSGKGTGASTCVAQCGSSSPIYEYDNVSDGVAHMCQFLKGSYYTGIVHALQQDLGLAAIYQAINSSPWCKGCQNGSYPVALAKAAGGGAASVSSGVGSGGSTAQGGGGTSGGGGGGAATTGSGLSDCVVQFPLSFSTPIGSLGGCILSKGQFKAITGAVAMAVGLGLVTFGIMVMAAAAFDASGAKQAVTKAAKFIPGEGGMMARVAGGGTSSGGRTSARTRAPRTSTGERVAGRRESRDIERQFDEAQRQAGPIGPRGGSPTSTRIAQRERSGRNVAGYGRTRTPEQRARARARASQPF